MSVVVAREVEPTVQFLKPFVRRMVGLAGTVKTEVAFGNAIETVSPSWREPVAVEVKPTVQAPTAFAASVVEAKLTAVGVVAATIVTAVALAAVVSALVLTLGWTAPAVGPFVTPRICRSRT